MRKVKPLGELSPKNYYILGEKKYSIGGFRSTVLRPCFSVMTRLAKRLPVILIPHEFLITTMRNDVVNNSCRNVSAFRHTLYTHRVLAEIGFAKPSPLAVVATLGG